MAFKMKGMSFGNSPMKQDKGAKLTKQKTKEKFQLMSGTKKNLKTGKSETEYFKSYPGVSTDGGKTFTKSKKTKISEAEYNSYFPKEKKGLMRESRKKAQ
tara:strand:+ start:4102 stop:4401 length:300 start_codon:yes stop_codon:yes gene_type:complete